MTIKNLLAHKYFYLIVAEIWTIFIAFICLAEFKNLPSVGIKGADKYVHFTLYFVFTLLWFSYFRKHKNSKNMVLKIFVCAVLFGILIEIAQGVFTTTRQADIFDALANTGGALFAVLLIYLYNVSLKKRIQ